MPFPSVSVGAGGGVNISWVNASASDSTPAGENFAQATVCIYESGLLTMEASTDFQLDSYRWMRGPGRGEAYEIYATQTATSGTGGLTAPALNTWVRLANTVTFSVARASTGGYSKTYSVRLRRVGMTSDIGTITISVSAAVGL